MTRVLHVITGLGRGGAEQQLLQLVRHMPGSVDTEVAVLTRPGPVAAALRAQGVRVHEIGMRGNRDLSALPRLARLMRDGRYDVVHTHLYRACVFGRIAARLAGVRTVVATEHSLGDGHIEGRSTSAAVRWLYIATERLGTVTVAVSPTVAGRLLDWGVPADRIVVIPNGIDAAAFAFDPGLRLGVRRRLGIAPDEFVFGAVGRLVPTKRFDLLIRAFARLEKGALLIVGDGPQRGELQELAARTGAASRTIFMGESGHVPGVLSAMDALAAPSEQETFGLSVVEGLAAGLPVLYTECPALADLPPGMVPDSARHVPARLPEWQEALARCMSEGRRRTVPPDAVWHYDISVHAKTLAELYESSHRSATGPRPEPVVALQQERAQNAGH
ncbi:glycosyl transferase [Actinomadura rubrobrunea]|uniref:Glycosyl transferase n=1 Tax=Actinomadura rubrobrunea TaxID=115335 RepID=A0A9W6PSC0_9ACTN|nr:glycosyltransferase [Actinomadura rubrobrunea]GLW61992.1 glycosyl transferase [Actinomadura rubrobrunea]